MAGWRVTGVDHECKYKARYGGSRFLCHKAIDFALRYAGNYDAIHASPPCQLYSITNAAKRDYPDLVAPTREALVATGLPYVIENVEGAPLLDPLLLCGSMFDMTARDTDGRLLRLERHRLFESNVPLTAPSACRHDMRVLVAGVYGGARSRSDKSAVMHRLDARRNRGGGYVPPLQVQKELIGIDWMTGKGLSQAIPPAYTEHIGRQLLLALAA